MNADDAIVIVEPEEGLEAAVEESRRIVEINGGRPPADRSLCLPANDADPSSLRRFGHATLSRLVLGILGLAGGGFCAFFDVRSDGENDAVGGLLILGMCLSFGGILVLCSNPFFQRRFVHRQIGNRYHDLLGSPYSSKPICINIEDAETFDKFKIVPEDLGYLAIDEFRGMLVVEGVRFRYFIHAKDVVDIRQVAGGNSTATVIEYNIGDARARIALQFDSIWHEIKRQTVGAKEDVLIGRIREALGGGDVVLG